jgi:hypothetical protein
MAGFTPNVPVVQNDPVVSVDMPATAPLPAGKYRFQLVVIDDAGTESDPAFIDVIIKDKVKPTAVLDMVNADKVVVNVPQVTVGQSFLLSGARSSEVAPGKVVSYRFTMLPAG